MKITEPQREISVNGEYDTAVCGGGIAGIAAALAASRHGKKVLLIEKEFTLGGLATLGLVTIYLPICDGLGRQVSFGISEELLKLSVLHGSEDERNTPWFDGGTLEERRERRYEVRFNPHVFAITAEQFLLKHGVEILYGSLITAVKTENDRITHIIIENKSGRSAVAVKTVIDATGDADICHLAGEGTVKHQKGNLLAAWSYIVEDGKYNLKPLGQCDIPDSQKEERGAKKPLVNKWFSGVDGKENSDYMILSHEHCLNNYLLGGGVSKSHALATIPTIPQFRMTRRIDGQYTEAESEMHKEFPDSVGLYSDWRRIGPVYELPFSCLIGKKISNLIAAGRCISSYDDLWDVTRVIPVASLSGQAAGTASALTDDFFNIDIAELQNTLENDGVVLHEKDLIVL